MTTYTVIPFPSANRRALDYLVQIAAIAIEAGEGERSVPSAVEAATTLVQQARTTIFWPEPEAT